MTFNLFAEVIPVNTLIDEAYAGADGTGGTTKVGPSANL